MRASERLVLFVAILVPMAVAFFGWPILEGWLNGATAPQPVSAPPGAAATSVALSRRTLPTPRPTPGAPPTVQPTGNLLTLRPEAATPAAVAVGPLHPPQPTPEAEALTSVQRTDNPQTVAPEVAGVAVTVAPDTSADPTEALASFYALVASHQFDTAATLWSPRMRAAFPPQENIAQRFSQTQTIHLQRADVLSQDQARATVAVDVLESSGQAGQQHFVGTWHLVRGSSGWMLDQPDLRPAP